MNVSVSATVRLQYSCSVSDLTFDTDILSDNCLLGDIKLVSVVGFSLSHLLPQLGAVRMNLKDRGS